MTRLLGAVLLTLAVLAGREAHALRPDEILADPAQEHRARDIGRELRCLVCQNQSIDDSDADLARDLRLLVRERIRAGDTDEQVLGYMQQRYGDFVLLRPPVRPGTYLLWFGPALLILLGVGGVFLYFRRRSPADATAAPLTEAERRRLDELTEQQTIR